MAVYRVNKNRGYTVMANYHLRDKTLSLKAVGLLSKMLSFNDGWQFSTKGLSAICKEGPDAVLAALRELEDAGYGVTEKFGILPLEAQTAYNAVKEAHPEAIVCFAQNGYFEIYGEDAKKAAPALGTKLLMKELEGGGQVAVTGFREDQWVAKAKALWGQGNDVLVTQPGEDGRQETVKHLLAEDYIPAGMVMDMDGKTVRVDKVDFPNEEVSLTDITDRKNPVPFRERLSIVRSYVEDAPAESLWKAMDRREHTSQKKTSVLAKLKEHAKSAPDKGAKKPEQTKKPKSKEMEM